jgi:hypothetical protein
MPDCPGYDIKLPKLTSNEVIMKKAYLYYRSIGYSAVRAGKMAKAAYKAVVTSKWDDSPETTLSLALRVPRLDPRCGNPGRAAIFTR